MIEVFQNLTNGEKIFLSLIIFIVILYFRYIATNDQQTGNLNSETDYIATSEYQDKIDLLKAEKRSKIRLEKKNEDE